MVLVGIVSAWPIGATQKATQRPSGDIWTSLAIDRPTAISGV